MWSYKIPTGITSQNGTPRAEVSYSGHEEFKNNAAYCDKRGLGPIPPGTYRIGPAYDHPHLGPVVMNLTPLPGTNTFDRDLFRWHGDSIAHPGEGSDGCICSPRSLRDAVNSTTDRVLQVVA